MIVRTYTRRTRGIGQSFSDVPLLDGGGSDPLDVPLSQDSSSQDPYGFVAFSSQDSSPWSFDSDICAHDDSPAVPSLPPPVNSLIGARKPPKKTKSGKLKRPDWAPPRSRARPPPVPVVTSTLMEAQEFGEMMEHVDEVNFALDGIRKGQPSRIRRASLLSLLSACATAQQRRLLRAQGDAKRIIDAVLDLSFDDSPSTVAAAALFYVLASDAQDDNLLNSSPCILFLLKLLGPPIVDAAEDKTPTIGSRLLGIRNHGVLSDTYRRLDSSSTEIISKVEDILLSCKEMNSKSEYDDGIRRPELSSKWIALLTMEKACLSTVSFEDTSDMVRRVGGNFKERLRELGGLDAIFNVAASCHSIMEGWLRQGLPSVWELKDGVALQSIALLLKCLKIMENATFLSKDNQNHLLGMGANLDSEGSSLSFVGLVISAMKIISGLSLHQSSCSNSKDDKTTDGGGAHFSSASEDQFKGSRKDDCDGTSSSHSSGKCGSKKSSPAKKFEACQKRQRSHSFESEITTSGLETIASDVNNGSIKKKAPASRSCNGLLRGVFSTNADCSKMSSTGGLNRRTSINRNGLTMDHTSGSKQRSSINAIGSNLSSVVIGKRPHASDEIKDGCMTDSYDPFAFDEDELIPSKWEILALRKEASRSLQSTLTDKKLEDENELLLITSNSESINGENQQVCESSSLSVVEEDSSLLEDCLLTAVKVLMNLTNDNPIGCQQIAACGGLDALASLIITHFPSFDLFISMPSESEKKNFSLTKSTANAGHLNSKHLSDHKLDFLVAILGLLVNLVEKDSLNRSRLASASVLVAGLGRSESKDNYRDVISLLCSIFLANQGDGETAGEGQLLSCDDEAAFLQGEKEAEMMIIGAYAALLLAFLSTESKKTREAIACCLPNHNLEVLVPVLERFVAFHLSLNMITPETHTAVCEVIESCKGP